MEPTTVFEAGAAALSLAEKLVSLIEESRKEDSPPRLTEIIQSLETSAIELCRDFGEELRMINTDLRESGIDVDKSIPDLYDNLNWYNFITKSKLKKHEQRFNEIYRSLAIFVDDVSAVLVCSEASLKLRWPFFSGRKMKRQLDELVFSDLSIREMSKRMLEIIDDIYARLQGAEVAA